jgi:predicted NAD/FAD-binding protein
LDEAVGVSERRRIVILGAGFAGLETAFLLRMRTPIEDLLVGRAAGRAMTVRPRLSQSGPAAHEHPGPGGRE